jgi:DNA-binding HxlR family transcriptional regulator
VVSEVIMIQAFTRFVSPKWSVDIIIALTRGPLRWNELETTLTATSGRVVYSKPLSRALHELQDKGFISRATDGSGAVYSLTDQGRDLERMLHEIAGWAERHSDALDL